MRIIATTLVIMLSTSAYAEPVPAGNNGTFSEGWRMGKLSKCSIKGSMNKSTECSVRLGENGSTSSVNSSTSTKWSFSNGVEAMTVLGRYAGKMVAIRYTQANMAGSNRDTDYSAVEIVPVTGKPGCEIETAPTGTYSTGFRVGHITKASSKGNFNKTDEIIVQVGGEETIRMSADNSKVAACATEWLLSGKEVVILYSQLGGFQFTKNDTDYVIYGLRSVE